ASRGASPRSDLRGCPKAPGEQAPRAAWARARSCRVASARSAARAPGQAKAAPRKRRQWRGRARRWGWRRSLRSAHVVVEPFVAALALDFDQYALSAPELLVEAHHVVHAGERLAVDVPDHVAWLQAQLFVQASGLDLAHQEAPARVGDDQRLAEELRLAHLLLQLPAVDDRSARRARLDDGHRGRRRRNQVGLLVEILQRHGLEGATAHAEDALALHLG